MDRFNGALRPLPVKLTIGLGALLISLLMLPAVAGAATKTYIGGNATSFADSNGGWAASSEYGGLCLQGVTCPVLSGEYVAAGGVGGAGDGFIRTNSGATTLAALLSTSTNTWVSPDFTYEGVGGKAPDQLEFTMSKNSSLGSLLALGATADFEVTAINRSGGSDHVIVASQPGGSDSGWTSVTADLGPSALVVGQKYAFRITVTIGGLAAVLPAGNIGFDDVALTATTTGNGGGGNGGGGGGNGGGGNGGGGNGAIKPPPAVIPPGKAYFYKGRLFMRIKCPARFKPACKVRAVGLTKRKRGKAMTRNARVNVRTNRFKRKALVVKPRFRAKVRKLANVKRKTLVVRLKIKSKRGAKKGTAFHKLRVLVRK